MISSTTQNRRRRMVQEAAMAATVKRAEVEAYVSARTYGRMTDAEARDHARNVRILMLVLP